MQRRSRIEFDPDKTRRDDAPYWAAALVLAIRSGNAGRAGRATRELKRLGVPLRTAAPPLDDAIGSGVYAVREGHSAKWGGDRKQSTVWDVALKDDTGDTNHGTQKPVECMARPIRHHGGKEDGVYDPFCGSGTTIIAAEKLGRRCWAMELDPAYCDVIVQRWEKFTGKKSLHHRAGEKR